MQLPFVIVTKDRDSGTEKNLYFKDEVERVVGLGEIDVHQFSYRFIDLKPIDPVDQTVNYCDHLHLKSIVHKSLVHYLYYNLDSLYLMLCPPESLHHQTLALCRINLAL